MTTKTHTDRDPFDLLGLAVLNLGAGLITGLGVTVWWALLFPMVSAPIALAVTAGVFLGPAWAAMVVGVSAAGMVLWRDRSPETFERWVSRRARHRFLTWLRYRRRWTRLMSACHLTVTADDRTTVPRLLGVRIGDSVDRVRVRMLPGHCPADWENRVAHLAHAFGAQECRATITGPATVELAFRHGDSLADPIALPHIDGGLDWGKEAA
ncbi:DNA segregation ATPase FtsK/SpoIIIE, S-DNA-T family [Nocardia amikacinitolerans]|uniref:DNA segregation ATPase FtsK/SpoIIIE, S-DNA-T family n=1 Tax=Nocardia amikacinitolerans TaxID=756689 RepID=A0A285L7E8_9NOCA|nr:hypothetical protein [Nocardia amikacinitolerans]SNY80383.1 DNA segregation ATPase FtsK/SpoIIIE, S-DNA-T family [Nocardia amikacinitolerans]